MSGAGEANPGVFMNGPSPRASLRNVTYRPRRSLRSTLGEYRRQSGCLTACLEWEVSMFKIAIAAGALAAALGATPAAAQYYYPYDTGCYDDWGNPVECYNYSYPFYGGPFFGFGGPF